MSWKTSIVDLLVKLFPLCILKPCILEFFRKVYEKTIIDSNSGGLV